jgi:hypothetical protein
MKTTVAATNGGGAIASSATGPVLVAIVSTVAACALIAFAYAKFFPAPKHASGRCVDSASSTAAAAPQTETLLRAFTTLASTSAEETPRQALAPQVAEEPAEVTSGEVFEISPEEARAKEKADADTLDTRLASEEADPCWAAQTERATRDAVARLGNDLRVADVTCRESLCRAHLIHHDARLADEGLERLLGIPVITGQAMTYIPPGEPGSTVLYFSRKGTSLSVFEAQVEMGQPPPLDTNEGEPAAEAPP